MIVKGHDKRCLGLRKLAKSSPLNWGLVQNDRSDDNINMFSIDSNEDSRNRLDICSNQKRIILDEDGI